MKKLLGAVLLVAGLTAGLLLPAPRAEAATQGVTTFACTEACTATGTITSTSPVTSVYPFFTFHCLDGRSYSTSFEVRPTRAAPVVAGVYTYTWTKTARSPYNCIGYAELTVFGASDNFQTDSRYAVFDTQL